MTLINCEPIASLWKLGAADWREWFDYVNDYNLTAKDIPALIEALHFNDRHPEYTRNLTNPKGGWLEVHAWRALTQLKAVEAIPEFIKLIQTDEEADWAFDELPRAIGMIGSNAIEALVKST